MATISVSLTPKLAERTRKIAEQEHRKNSSVVAAALELYTGLPHEVRHIVDSLRGSLRPREREQLNRTIKEIAFAREMTELSQEAAANLEAQGRTVELLSEAELVARSNEAIRATRTSQQTVGIQRRRSA